MSNANENEISYKFIVFILSFWVIFVLAFNFYNYKVGMLATVIMLVVFLKFNYLKRYLFILSVLPFASIFKVRANYPSSSILFYMIYILCRVREGKKFSKQQISVLALLFALQLYTVVKYNSNIVPILSFLINITFTWICTSDLLTVHNKDDLYENCGMIFSLSMIINIVASKVFSNLKYVINGDKQLLLDNVGRFAALNGDPNYYNQLVLVSIALLIPIVLNLIIKRKYNKLILSIGMIVFLLISGAESISKSYVVTLMILIGVIGYFCIVKISKKNYSFIVIPILIVVTIICGITFFNKIVVPVINERENSLGVLTGRDVIWKSYVDFLNENPKIKVFGAGFGNGRYEVAKNTGEVLAAHNMYLEMLIDIGILGIALLVTFWYSIFKRLNLLLASINSLYLWVFFITSFAISVSSFDAVYVILPIIAVSNYKNKVTIKNDRLIIRGQLQT